MHANGTVYLIGAMVRKPSGTTDHEEYVNKILSSLCNAGLIKYMMLPPWRKWGMEKVRCGCFDSVGGATVLCRLAAPVRYRGCEVFSGDVRSGGPLCV